VWLCCTGIRYNVLRQKRTVALIIRQQLNKKHDGMLAVKIIIFENGRIFMGLNITVKFITYVVYRARKRICLCLEMAFPAQMIKISLNFMEFLGSPNVLNIL